MDNQYLERDAMGSWILTHYVDEPEGDALIEYIIYWGKILYLIEACYPEDDERIILRYTKDDYQWALDNEASFWNYLMDQKLLFKADERTRVNLLKEGPFTPGLPEDTENSPDRLGQFLGWRMVHQYMEDSDTSVKGLVDVDYKEIYQGYETEE